nr:potassium channel family protein [Agrilactobacillus composti]
MLNTFNKIYTIFISLLALISVIMVVADFSNTININRVPYLWIDNSILIIFTLDYFGHLFTSKNKIEFIKTHIFDLLAIIPFSTIFYFFRLSRIFRIVRIARVFRFARLIGLMGKLQKNSAKFLKHNGLIYLIYISIVLLLISSVLYALAESVPLSQALWWAVATATTVGYGDISPHTLIGKLAAVLLMFVGIGFIGMLTSSITTYFTDTHEDSKYDQIIKKLESLERENQELSQQIRELKKDHL